MSRLSKHLETEHDLRTLVEVGTITEASRGAYFDGVHDGQHGRLDTDDLDFTDPEMQEVDSE